MCSFFIKNGKVLIIKIPIKFQICYAFKALLKLHCIGKLAMSDQLIFKRLIRKVLIFFSRWAKLKFRQEEKNCILTKFYVITELFVIWHAQSSYTALGKLG
jgi:hypothetical protein